MFIGVMTKLHDILTTLWYCPVSLTSDQQVLAFVFHKSYVFSFPLQINLEQYIVFCVYYVVNSVFHDLEWSRT